MRLSTFAGLMIAVVLADRTFAQPPPPPPDPTGRAYSNVDGFFAVGETSEPNVIMVFPPSTEVISPKQQKLWKFEVKPVGPDTIDFIKVTKYQSTGTQKFFLAFSIDPIGTFTVSGGGNSTTYAIYGMWYSFDPAIGWKRWKTITGTILNNYGTFSPELSFGKGTPTSE